MSKLELNNLAICAQKGCKESGWKIVGALSQYIYEEVDKVRNRVASFESLEKECFAAVESTIRNFKPDGVTFYWLAKNNIQQRIRRQIGRHDKRGIAMIPLVGSNDDGDEVTLDIEDVLANVENIVELRSEIGKVALLAEGDSVKETILANWLGGYTDTDSAAILANRFGKKSESMRKTIQRFRSHCQKALA